MNVYAVFAKAVFINISVLTLKGSVVLNALPYLVANHSDV
jgi:hypothetical protein